MKKIIAAIKQFFLDWKEYCRQEKIKEETEVIKKHYCFLFEFFDCPQGVNSWDWYMHIRRLESKAIERMLLNPYKYEINPIKEQ